MRKPSVDQVRDRDLALLVTPRLQQLVVGVLIELTRKFLHEPAECKAHVLELLDALRIEAGLAGVADVFFALEHLIQIHRQLASCAEEIDLHDQCADIRRIVQDVPQR